MRISDWSSDVCSSDLAGGGAGHHLVSRRLSAGRQYRGDLAGDRRRSRPWRLDHSDDLVPGAQSAVRFRAHPAAPRLVAAAGGERSEEHTSELQSLMRISYAVFCLKKKTKTQDHNAIVILTE